MAVLKSGSTILKPSGEEKIVTIPQVTEGASNKLNKSEFSTSSGSFTPRLFAQSTAGSFTYGARTGRYTTIGDVVFIVIYLYISAIGTPPNGILNIGGLPFNTKSQSALSVAYLRGLQFGTSTMVSAAVSNTADYRDAIYLYNSNMNGQFWNVFGSEVLSNFAIMISGFYFK